MKKGKKESRTKEELRKSPSKSVHEIRMEESRTAYSGQRKVYVIDSEEYREGTYEKLDNRYPLGVLSKDDRVLMV